MVCVVIRINHIVPGIKHASWTEGKHAMWWSTLFLLSAITKATRKTLGPSSQVMLTQFPSSFYTLNEAPPWTHGDVVLNLHVISESQAKYVL